MLLMVDGFVGETFPYFEGTGQFWQPLGTNTCLEPKDTSDENNVNGDNSYEINYTFLEPKEEGNSNSDESREMTDAEDGSNSNDSWNTKNTGDDNHSQNQQLTLNQKTPATATMATTLILPRKSTKSPMELMAATRPALSTKVAKAERAEAQNDFLNRWPI